MCLLEFQLTFPVFVKSAEGEFEQRTIGRSRQHGVKRRHGLNLLPILLSEIRFPDEVS